MSEETSGHAFAITPHDTNSLAYATSRIFVGGTGTLTVTMASGQDCLFTGVPAGAILPIRCTKVKSTGTTCTNIVGLT